MNFLEGLTQNLGSYRYPPFDEPRSPSAILIHLRIAIPTFIALPLIYIAIVYTPPMSLEQKAARETTTLSRASSQSKLGKTETSPQSISVWLENWRVNPSAQTLDEGVKLAEARRKRMSDLIQNNPGAAIDEMLSYQDYRDLPDTVASQIEIPFAAFGKLEVIHRCFNEGDHGHDSPLITGHWNGTTKHISLPVERNITHSKESMPFAGIEIDGYAALHRIPAPALSSFEAKAAAELFHISFLNTEKNDAIFLLGNSLTTASKTIGKGLDTNKALYMAERKISPKSISVALQYFGNPNISPSAFQSLLDENDNEWTTRSKTHLFVRIGFANRSNTETVERVESVLDWVRDTLIQYSYGNTTIESYTIPEVIDLPNNIEFYYNEQDQVNSNAIHKYVDPILEAKGYPIENYDIVAYQYETTPQAGSGAAATTQVQYIRGTPRNEAYLHEFGHNFGLHHANSWNTLDGSILPPYGESRLGSNVEYGDRFDRMGNAPEGEAPHFNAYYKSYLDWIPEENVKTINFVSDQTIRIHRFDHPNALEHETLLVNIDYPFTHPLALSYRSAFTENENLLNGLYMQWIHYPGRARLLDMTPDSGSPTTDWNDPALPIGNVFEDSLRNLSIEPLRTGGDNGNEWIEVRIRVGSEDNAPPRLTLSGPSHSPARYPVSFSIEASDPENDSLEVTWQIDGVTNVETSEQLTTIFWEEGTYEIESTVHDGQRNYTTDQTTLIVSDPLIPWTSLTPFDSKSRADKFKFSGGNFIAFNDFEGISSPDGISTKFFDPNILLSDICIGQNIYVAVGASSDPSIDPSVVGRIEQSLDGGSSWQPVPLPQEIPKLTCTEFANGTWLAGGPGNILLRKAVGEEWQLNDAPWTEEIVSILSSNGQFLVRTESGRLYSSEDDGLSWIDSTFNIGVEAIETLTSGDGLLLAVANATAYVSRDEGKSWSQAALGYENATLVGAACSTNLFYVAAEYKIEDIDFTLARHQAISIDGSTWKLKSEEILSAPTAVAIGNKRLGFLWPDGVVEISSPHRSAFGNWMANALPNSDSFAFNPSDDTDGDSIVDIGEYSFGTNPGSFDTNMISIDHLQDTKPIIARCRSNNPYLRYYCSVSENLNTWESVPLCFDSSLNEWSAESDLIEVTSLETEEEGVWELSISLSPERSPLFIQLSAEYESPLP